MAAESTKSDAGRDPRAAGESALLLVAGEGLLATHALAAPSLHSTGGTMGEVPVAKVARPGAGRWLIPLLLVACVVGAGAYEWYRGGRTMPGDPTRGMVPNPNQFYVFAFTDNDLPQGFSFIPQPFNKGDDQGNDNGNGGKDNE